MIKKSNLEGVRAYSDTTTIPKGGYVCRILGAVVKENRVGQYVEISMDIVEGEFKDFFANDYRAQTEPRKWHCIHLLSVPNDDGTERDGWTKRAFKTFVDAVEGSNPGYHFDWDETGLKGKLVGCLFREEDYKASDGSIRTSTKPAAFTTADKVRAGKYRLPRDKRLSPEDGNMTAIPSNDQPNEGDDLPF